MRHRRGHIRSRLQLAHAFSSRFAETERGVERRQRRAEEQASLDPGHERRLQQERQQLRHHLSHEGVRVLYEQHSLGLELHAVQRFDVALAETLHALQIPMQDWAAPEARMQFLRRHGGRGNRELTPIAPAGLMVCAASPMRSRPSRAQSSTRRTKPSSGKA